MISCGVNNIDTNPGYVVADKILDIVKYIKQKYPDIKIILSEVTPRNDHLDGEVQRCNEILANSITGDSVIHFVKQQNLRDANWSMYHDVKHIKKNNIGKYAANLKYGLRAAYGIPNKYNSNRGSPNNMINRYNHPRQISNVNNNLQNMAGYQRDEHVDLKRIILERLTDALRDL